jgi:hypothetical protein
MNKKQIFEAILTGASAYIPGGPVARAGIDHLIHRNADPTDDVDEVAGAIAEIAVGSMLAAEGLSEKDIVHDAIYLQVLENIKGDIRLFQHLIVRTPTPAA